MKFLKKILIWGIIAAFIYFILSNHFIFIDNTVRLLKKSTLTLEYTLFNAKGKTNKKILEIDVLREDGIADILIEEGVMTEKEGTKLLSQYEEVEED